MTPSPLSFVVDRNSSVSLHRQIEEWLRAQIESGNWGAGYSLPPRKEFCEMLGGINHLTIRQAVTALVRDGLLTSVPGKGTFVTERATKPLSIGLVLPQIEDELTRSIAQGVNEGFLKSNSAPLARVVLFDSGRSAQKEIENIAHLEDLPLDGAIVMPVIHSDLSEHLLRLKIDKFPLVLVDSNVPGVDVPSVTSDNYKGGYDIASHLVERGYKRMAWIGNCKGYYSAQQRFDGFRDALNDAGIPYNRSWFFEHQNESPTDPVVKSVRNIVGRILDEDMPIDAIVCANDGEALACLDLLKERGIPVPQKIAVTGFDDAAISLTSTPPLTTVRQSVTELGREAAHMLLQVIKNSSTEVQRKILPVHLVVRKSS